MSCASEFRNKLNEFYEKSDDCGIIAVIFDSDIHDAFTGRKWLTERKLSPIKRVKKVVNGYKFIVNTFDPCADYKLLEIDDGVVIVCSCSLYTFLGEL